MPPGLTTWPNAPLEVPDAPSFPALMHGLFALVLVIVLIVLGTKALAVLAALAHEEPSMTITKRSVVSGTMQTMDVHITGSALIDYGNGHPLAEVAPT